MLIQSRSTDVFKTPDAGASGVTYTPLVAPESVGILGSLYTQSDRGSSYQSNFTSSGPWTTFQMGSAAYTDTSLIQWINLALGDGYGLEGTSQQIMGSANATTARTLEFANGNRLGNWKENYHLSTTLNYIGSAFRMIPLRNTTSGPINVTINGYGSSYGNGVYDGTSIFYLTPNTNKYSTVSSVSSTQVAFVDTNIQQGSLTGTITIPGNTTVIVCFGSSDFYGTTNRYITCNFIYNIDTLLPTGVICDMRMLSSLQQTRFNITYNGTAAGTGLLAPLWTKTATNFGDR